MRISLLFTTIITSLLFFSCETDIDKDAEYKDMTIVYGLLDPNESSHYIKINKGFIGDGDANDLAGNSDNYNYANGEISVKIDEYTSAGVFVTSHSLTRTINEIPKDDGVFDNSTNVLYKFIEPNLNIDNTYKLSIYNASLNKEITAETDIVQEASIGAFNVLKFINSASSGGAYLTPTPFNVVPTANTGRIKADLMFNYTEYYTNTTTTVDKSIRIPMGEELATNLQGNGLEFTLSGSVFFSTITSAIPTNTPNILQRRINNATVEYTYAGLDLSTYMSINAPSLGANQNQLEFTNISNGLGIFSSRTTIEKSSAGVPGIGEPGYDGSVDLGEHTLKKLITIGREFCTVLSAGDASTSPQNICQ